MSIKVYTSGNYFYVEEESGRIHAALAKNVLIKPSYSPTSQENQYTIRGVEGWNEKDHLKLSEITDETGTAYSAADFRSFYESELGKARAGGSAATTVTKEEFQSLEDNNEVDNTLTYYII